MTVEILTGDCRSVLSSIADGRFQCCVTSPPYFGLRDYGVAGQIGLESTVEAYVAELVAVFREVRRALRDDGTLWLNLGDSYASSGGVHTSGSYDNGVGRHMNGVARFADETLKPKDLIGIPWRVAFALQADGWWLRSDIIWSKPNPMPESVRDRPTKAHEYIFLLTKAARYFYDAEAIKEPARESGPAGQTGGAYKPPGQAPHSNARLDKQRGHGRRHAGFNDRWDAMSKDEQQAMGANARTVWEIATHPYSEAHFATFPPALAERCVKAGSREGDAVLDPFGGAGTTGLVADRLGRDAVLIELNPEYVEMARQRIERDCPMFAVVSS